METVQQEISEKKRQANRRNARSSTGPRTAGGKGRSRLNALKAGGRTDSFRASLEALGEDREEFERLYRDLLSACDPADPLWRRQVEDLAQLYWELDRERRIQAAVRLSELERLEEEARRRMIETERGMYFGPAAETGGGGLVSAPDSEWKFEQLVFHLDELIVTVEAGNFSLKKHPAHLEEVFGNIRTWFAVRVRRLFARLTPDEHYSAPVDRDAQNELQRILEEARDQVNEDWERFKSQGRKTSPAARVAAMAPTSRQWVLMNRRENTLTRAIDRKVRLLVDFAARARERRVPGQNHGRVRSLSNNADQRENKITSVTEPPSERPQS